MGIVAEHCQDALIAQCDLNFDAQNLEVHRSKTNPFRHHALSGMSFANINLIPYSDVTQVRTVNCVAVAGRLFAEFE